MKGYKFHVVVGGVYHFRLVSSDMTSYKVQSYIGHYAIFINSSIKKQFDGLVLCHIFTQCYDRTE
jgi:hypothetical protein